MEHHHFDWIVPNIGVPTMIWILALSPGWSLSEPVGKSRGSKSPKCGVRWNHHFFPVSHNFRLDTRLFLCRRHLQIWFLRKTYQQQKDTYILNYSSSERTSSNHHQTYLCFFLSSRSPRKKRSTTTGFPTMGRAPRSIWSTGGFLHHDGFCWLHHRVSAGGGTLHADAWLIFWSASDPQRERHGDFFAEQNLVNSRDREQLDVRMLNEYNFYWQCSCLET